MLYLLNRVSTCLEQSERWSIVLSIIAIIFTIISIAWESEGHRNLSSEDGETLAYVCTTHRFFCLASHRQLFTFSHLTQQHLIFKTVKMRLPISLRSPGYQIYASLREQCLDDGDAQGSGQSLGYVLNTPHTTVPFLDEGAITSSWAVVTCF